MMTKIITDIASLTQPSRKISLFEAGDILLKLGEMTGKHPCLGMSAVQIGINVAACIINTRPIVFLVNPEVVEQYDLREFHGEGCLSFPGQRITTKRHNEIFVKDSIHPNGVIFSGLEAVIVAHEIDHINGIVMMEHEITIPGRNEKCWCGSGNKYKKCCDGRLIQ